MNLEDLANERMAKLPGMQPLDMSSIPGASPISNTQSQKSGLDSLLPLLMSLNKNHQTTGTTPDVGGTPSHWEQVAQKIGANRYGYSPSDFTKLDSIISRESSWDPNAVNSNGGAWGIPQILPAAHPGLVPGSLDPREQINWLYKYIEGKYGGVDQALAYKNAHGSY